MSVSAESLGFSPQRLQRLTDYMQQVVDDGRLAGVVTLIARDGQIAHMQAQGMMNLEDRTPMAADTIMRIASMTKPIVTVAALTLLEEGLIGLPDPVSRYLPPFADTKVFVARTSGRDRGRDKSHIITRPPSAVMTVEHLMMHTAGLSYGWYDDTPVDPVYRDARVAERNVPPDDWVRDIARLPLVSDPGTQWRYSLATDVLGCLVSTVAGEPLPDVLRRRVLDPLGMSDTGFMVAPEKVGRLAALYQAGDRGLEVVDKGAGGRFTRAPIFPSGGGGLVSTTLDYYRFAQMLLNGGELDGVRVLGRKTVELMCRNHLPLAACPIGFPDSGPRPGLGFGLGVQVAIDAGRTGYLGSDGTHGWSGAHATVYWVDPKERMVGLVMPQLANPTWESKLHADARNLAYQALI